MARPFGPETLGTAGAGISAGPRAAGSGGLLGTWLHLERARKERGLESREDFLVLDVGALEHTAGPAFERGHFLFGFAVLILGEHPDEKRLQFIVVADLAHDFRALDLGRFPVDEQGVERKVVKDFQSFGAVRNRLDAIPGVFQFAAPAAGGGIVGGDEQDSLRLWKALSRDIFRGNGGHDDLARAVAGLVSRRGGTHEKPTEKTAAGLVLGVAHKFASVRDSSKHECGHPAAACRVRGTRCIEQIPGLT